MSQPLPDRLRSAALDLEQHGTGLSDYRYTEIITAVREAADKLTVLRELVEQIRADNRNPDMVAYNQCETDEECAWCSEARAALADLPSPLTRREPPSGTLENIAMFARRGLSFGKQATPMTPARIAAHRALMLEAILDKCEQAGVTSSPLRESPSPPTEAKP